MSRTQKKFLILFIVAVIIFSVSLPAMAESWNFAVFGDTRSSSSSPGVNTTTLDAIATDIVDNRNCTFALVVGDLVYSGTSSQYDLFKNTTAAAGLKLGGSSGSEVPYYPVRGNHEGSNTTRWRSYFDTVPQNGPTTASGGGGNSEAGLTYSFTYDNALVLGLDEYINTGHRLNNDWVNQTVANNTQPHVFVFGHDPAYQANHSDCLAQNQTRRDAFLTSLYNAGGRIYFAGHDHLTAVGRAYEKSPASGGTQGFYQIIIGGGGAPAHNFNGVYNSSYPSDYNVTDLYHDSDSGAGVTFHTAYAVVTVSDSAEWVRIYGTTSLSPPDWQILFQMVVGGTLETDTNTISGNITVESGIDFNQGFDATYSGVISGLGNFTKSGSGTLTLSADNTYTGTTTASGGTLIINGNSSSTAVTVNTAAVFGGTGTVESLTNYGTVKPGTSIGTLNLEGGSFTQGPSGVLEIEVSSTSSYDKIIGCSNANLDGTLKTITAGNYVVGDTLVGVIETTGGIAGAFSTLDTQITPTIIWKPQLNGNNLDLVATRDYNNGPLKASLTPNQKSVATTMQAVLPLATGDLATVKSAIDSLGTNAEVAKAYSEISGEKFNGIPSVSFSNAVTQFNNIDRHIYALRTGTNVGLAFNRQTGDFSGDLSGGVLIAYNGDDWAKFIPRNSTQTQEQSRFGFFINGNGYFADQDSTASQPGFHYSAGAVTSGLDYRLMENLIAGLHIGYTRAASHLGGSGGKVDIDSISYGIYLAYYADSFYVNGVSDFSSNFYDTERNIVFGGLSRKAKGDTFGQQWNLFLGTGYDFHMKKLKTGPTLTMKYSQLTIDSFSESGADSLDLHIQDQRAESFQLGPGWRVEYELKAGKKILLPRLYASYQHEFSNDGYSIEARLAQGGDTFQSDADEPGDNFALVGCGMGMQMTESVSLDIGYETQIGQRNYSAHSVNARINIAF